MTRLTTAFGILIAVAVASTTLSVAAQVAEANATQVFYVTPDGDDTGDGTEADPLRSLAAARDAVRAFKADNPETDITVYFRGGRYLLDETVVFGVQDSAGPAQHITYQAYPGERPVFTSGELIGGWQLVSDPPEGLPASAVSHVWEADVPEGWLFKTLYDGEQLVPRAQGPGFAPTVRYRLDGSAPESSYWELQYPEGAMRDWSNVTDAEVVIIPTAPWMRNILPVAAVDEAARVATMQVPGRYPLGTVWSETESVWLENVVDVLDEPGEWAVNSQTGKVYYWAVDGTPGDMRAPRLKELVLVEGDIDEEGPVDTPVRGLTFRGLTFTQGERDTYPADYRGHEMQHAWDLPDRANALVRFRGVEDSSIEDSVFANSGNNAIRCDLHCQRNTFSGNLIHDVGAAGIILAGYGPGTKDVNHDNVVVDNFIYRVGRLYAHGMGIWAWQSGSNLIAHNRIHDTPYTGLAVTGRIAFTRTNPLAEATGTVRWDEIEAVTEVPEEGWTVDQYHSYEPFLHGGGNLVEDNDISGVMTVLHDGNAIYVSGQARGNVVRRNYLHDIDSPNLGYALRTDDAQYGTLMTDNVIDSLAREGGIVLKQQNDIVNNIVANLDDPEAYLALALGPVEGSTIQQNVYYSTKSGQPVLREGPSYRGPDPRLTETESDFNTYYSTMDPDWGGAFLEPYQLSGYEMNSLTTDPQFYDPVNGDFRMRPGSISAAMGFRQIDLSSVGLTADFPYAQDEPLQRLFVSAGDEFASIRMGDRASVKLDLTARTVIGYLADLSDATVEYTTSDPTVVTVADGVVSAVGAGTAEITVTAESGGSAVSTSIVVTVGVDGSMLAALVGYADALAAAAVPGNGVGEYPPASYAAFVDLVDSARAVLDDPQAEQADVDAMVDRLREGVRRFNESVVLAEVTVVNDDDAAIGYSGTWTYYTGRPTEFQQDLHATQQNGASATFTFTGSRVELVGPRTPNNGRAEVYLDGELVETIQPTAPNYVGQQVVFDASGLEESEHTIEIRKLDGTYLQLDAIRYYQAPADDTTPPDACPDSDTRDTVIIGGIDSTVANIDTGDGCTISDLIDDEGDWPSHAVFVRQVSSVADGLVADGVITSRERGMLTRTAAASDVGRPPA